MVSAPKGRQMISAETLTFTFTVPKSCAPALKSALEDVDSKLGTKIEGVNRYAVEDAWTRGALALAALRVVINQQVFEGDPDYE